MCMQCVFLSQFCVFSGFIFLLKFYYGSERSPGVQQECLNQLMMMCIAHNNNIFRLIAMRNSYERTVWSFSRIQGIVENEYRHFNDRKWLESYRVPKTIFSQLCTFFNSLCGKTTQMRKPVPVQVITSMVLKRLGKGLDYREIGDKFGVGASTANEKVNDAMLFLIKIKLHTISRLQERRNLAAIIGGSLEKWNLPQCLGAIDGTHIPIKAPEHCHTDYFNRKCFHSIIVQAVCDSECRFTDVFAGWPGRAHDARVFNVSIIGGMVTNETLVPEEQELSKIINGKVIEPFLIGDPAYPLSKHLMKDYPGSNLSPEKEYFN